MSKVNTLKFSLFSAITIASLMLSTRALAAVVEVKELNQGSNGQMMVFEPALVKIAPGDSVHFVPVTKGHDVASITGMLPEGATSLSGELSSDYTVKFDKPGVYGYRCKPHYGMGMVGLIVVGKPTNEDAAKAAMNSEMPPLAKNTLTKAFAELDGK